MKVFDSENFITISFDLMFLKTVYTLRRIKDVLIVLTKK